MLVFDSWSKKTFKTINTYFQDGRCIVGSIKLQKEVHKLGTEEFNWIELK
jgi:hypothetical protein